MSKHTSGPWVAIKDGKYVTENPYNVDHEDGHDLTTAPIGGPDGQVVALVVMDDEFRKNRWDDTELDANASLIAAAPELLAACQAFKRLYGRLWDVTEPNGAGFLSPESVKEYDAIHELMTAAINKATA